MPEEPAARLRMENFEIAGKTGTAQNSALNSGGAKDHAWFVSFAPAYKPEIAVIALIENAGFGSNATQFRQSRVFMMLICRKKVC